MIFYRKMTYVYNNKILSIIKKNNIKVYDKKDNIKIIKNIIDNNNLCNSFSILDIGSVIRQYNKWKQFLPNVELFYAVKCNPDPLIIKTLSKLGVGFDVASKLEIIRALKNNTATKNIIYANPCKRDEYIEYAKTQNISMMTFDNENELLKIARLYPKAELILRIYVDDLTKSKMHFGSKYGCHYDNIDNILQLSKLYNLNVIGISFHVGSSCTDPESYYKAIKRAYSAFLIGYKNGYEFKILDIGGGFPDIIDDKKLLFESISINVNKALNKYFSSIKNLRVIAEPGRYISSNSMIHVVCVIGKKVIYINNKKTFHYYIDSSLYGMFNNIIFDHGIIKFYQMKYNNSQVYNSTIFGETCDSMDKIIENVEIEELSCGDFLYVKNHGAYTIASSSNFNGFVINKPFYIFTNDEV